MIISTLDEHGQEVVDAVHNIRMDSGDMEEGEHRVEYLEEEDYEEADDVTHPTLKVSQIKTDVFPCNRCERSFPLKQLLEIHMQNHNRERKFGCDECGRKFFSKYDLGKHYLVHTGDKPFTCSVCAKAFSRESLLHRHEKIHIEVPKYLCTQCDRTFLTREDLDNHSEKHKKRRPFQCSMCNKSFVFKQGLERHEVTHSDKAAHKCNYCEASFSTAGKLARHITSHAGIRPYPCKVCTRTFLLSHHLTRHMRTSHGSSYVPQRGDVSGGNGQFKCDVCSMSFRRKDSLINHTAIHSMVNLKCIICNTSFSNAKLVKDHITTHLTGLPHPCDKCEYSFDTQQQLEEHEVKHLQYTQVEDEKDYEEPSAGEDDYETDEYIVPDETPVSDSQRKSARSRSIKNYAQFLKDELGSDSESNVGDGEDEKDLDIVVPNKNAPVTAESIKPVVRSEGTKVYQRKGKAIESPKVQPRILNQMPSRMATDEEISQPTTLQNLGLSQQTLNEMPDKKFIEMKIGEKIVRVKKLMMTKAEIEAMAKQGKIAMKGNTILLKNNQLNALQKPPQSILRQSPGKAVAATADSPKSSPAGSSTVTSAAPRDGQFKQISIETIIGHPKPTQHKVPAKKTYVRKEAEVSGMIFGEKDGSHGGAEEVAAPDDDNSKDIKAEKIVVRSNVVKEEKVVVENAETIEGQSISNS